MLLQLCEHKEMILNDFQFALRVDMIYWRREKTGKFSVKSMYNAITPNIIGTCHKHIWKRKNPPKVKIFVWLMENNAILTKGYSYQKRMGC